MAKKKKNVVVTRVITLKRKKSKVKNRKKRTKKRNVNASMPAEIRQGIKLVSNPCMGPISRTIGSGAITERIRSSITGNGIATSTCGYIAWFPSYHNAGVGASPANLVYWESTSSSATPINTNAAPFGTGTGGVNNSGYSYPDPASTTLGSVFGRAKTMSACLQLEYTGKLSDISGQVAIIKNLPLRALFSNTTSTIIAPIPVDTLFAFAGERERLQVTGHEVIWRPTDTSSIFRTGGGERSNASLATDTVWEVGVVGSSTSTLSAVDAENMYGMCIAWKGIPAVQSCLNINLVKVVDLELYPSGSAIESPVIPPAVNVFNPMQTVTTWLDRFAPQWQSRAVNATVNVAGLLARAYAPQGVSVIRNGLRGNDFRSITDL